MAVNIVEFNALPTPKGGVFAGIYPSAYTDQNVSASGSSTQSAAFGDATRFIRVSSDLAIGVELGVNPTATAASFRIAANESVVFEVQGGHKLAVILVT
jgi:hypothetical protein